MLKKSQTYYAAGLMLAASMVLSGSASAATFVNGVKVDDGTVKGANDLIAEVETESEHGTEAHDLSTGVDDKGGRRKSMVSFDTAKPSVSRVFFVEAGKGSLEGVPFGDILDGKAQLPKKVKIINEIDDDLTQITEDRLTTHHDITFDKVKKGKTVQFVIVTQRPDGSQRSVSPIQSVKTVK